MRPFTASDCRSQLIVGFQRICIALVVTLTVFSGGCTADAKQWIFSVGDQYALRFEGGMRLRAGTYGSSRIAYATGPIAVSEASNTVWIAGHAHHFSVGAFELLDPSYSFSIGNLPIAKNTQPFVRVKPSDNLEGKPDRITGLQVINEQLWVNVAEYYDASGKNRNTTAIFSDALDIGQSEQYGYFHMEGGAHASGWMSPIPRDLQAPLGGSYLTGYASNIPINSRHSIGPSLFVFNPNDITFNDAGSVIETSTKIDYSLRNPLHDDGYNKSGLNDLWTELSNAHLGFIPPDSNNYLIIGTSGGHESGIGYKITQDNGTTCGGACAYRHNDVYNYFWLYELADVEANFAAGGSLPKILPIDYGVLPAFEGREVGGPQIIGAAFSPESSRVYLLFGSTDKTQSKYESQPVLMVYTLLRRDEVAVASSVEQL